jgi:hypothetical protein
MTIPTVRTTTHDYSREELEAMLKFYGGKRCVIQRTLNVMEWAHILDTSIGSLNGCVSQSHYILQSDAEYAPISF